MMLKNKDTICTKIQKSDAWRGFNNAMVPGGAAPAAGTPSNIINTKKEKNFGNHPQKMKKVGHSIQEMVEHSRKNGSTFENERFIDVKAPRVDRALHKEGRKSRDAKYKGKQSWEPKIWDLNVDHCFTEQENESAYEDWRKKGLTTNLHAQPLNREVYHEEIPGKLQKSGSAQQTPSHFSYDSFRPFHMGKWFENIAHQEHQFVVEEY